MKLPRRTLLTMLCLAVVGLSPWGFGAQAADKRINATKPVRIAVMKFSHETVTFLPYDTTTDDFIFEGSPARGEALLSSCLLYTSPSPRDRG